jgi:hypothetical protein
MKYQGKNEYNKKGEDSGAGNEGHFVDVDDMKDDRDEVSFRKHWIVYLW